MLIITFVRSYLYRKLSSSYNVYPVVLFVQKALTLLGGVAHVYASKKSRCASITYITVCYIETIQLLRVPAFVNSFNESSTTNHESSTTNQGSMQRDKNHCSFNLYCVWIATYTRSTGRKNPVRSVCRISRIAAEPHWVAEQ